MKLSQAQADFSIEPLVPLQDLYQTRLGAAKEESSRLAKQISATQVSQVNAGILHACFMEDFPIVLQCSIAPSLKLTSIQFFLLAIKPPH